MKKLVITLLTLLVVIGIVGGILYATHHTNGIQTANTVNTQNNMMGIPVEKPEDTIKKLDTAYWQAAQFNDYATAYDFFQPADKALISKADYIQKESAPSLTTINSVAIVGVNVTGNTALAHVMIKGNTGSYPGTDTFSLQNGKWYKVMSEDNKKFLGIGQ